jgi:hypothetical protein
VRWLISPLLAEVEEEDEESEPLLSGGAHSGAFTFIFGRVMLFSELIRSSEDMLAFTGTSPMELLSFAVDEEDSLDSVVVLVCPCSDTLDDVTFEVTFEAFPLEFPTI